MDQDRQIRLLIPPFLFFASLVVGLLFDNPRWAQLSQSYTKDSLVPLGAVIAAALLPIGFILSAASGIVLRLLFLPFRKPYEACLSSEALQSMYQLTGVDDQIFPKPDGTASDQLFAAVSFDHSIIESGIHTWIMRRWNAFNISTTSLVALILALSVAPLFAIHRSRSWWITSVAVGFLLVVNAILAWRGTMHMVEFQAVRLGCQAESK
jgi:hypothetical protein